MLFKASSQRGYEIAARDGAIGSVDDWLFDQRSWTVRWAVIDTGRWLPGRRVLLPPQVLGTPDVWQRAFAVDLTRQQVEESPDASLDEPVSRQHEIALYEHYGWSPYWSLAMPGDLGIVAAGMPPETRPEYAREKPGAGGPYRGDPCLQSVRDVVGYRIEASDGMIGDVDDFLIEASGWQIRYVVVDTGRWLPGKTVLISPLWIDGIAWDERRVRVRVTRAAVENSPGYRPEMAIDRDYEARLHDYYGEPLYWGF
jgi:hypothetical protein